MHKIIKIQSRFCSLGKLRVVHFLGNFSMQQHSLAGLTSSSTHSEENCSQSLFPPETCFSTHTQTLFPL